MRYPTITSGKVRELATQFEETGWFDPESHVVEQNGPESPIPDLSGIAKEVARLRSEFEGAGGADRDLLEGRIGAFLFDRLKGVHTSILDDPGFWNHLATKHQQLWDFVRWRESRTFDNGEPSKYLKYVDAHFATEAVLHRAYLRGRIAGTEELATNVPEATDFWRSHITRVSTGAAPVVARAFIHEQASARMPTSTLRPFARRLNRMSTNIVLPYLNDDDAAALIASLREENEEDNDSSTTPTRGDGS